MAPAQFKPGKSLYPPEVLSDRPADEYRNFASDYVEIDDSDDEALVEMPAPAASNVPKYIRNLPITGPLQELLVAEHNGIKVRHASDLELVNGNFLRVKAIYRHKGVIMLRGLFFRKSKFLPVPDRVSNEVCLVAEQCKDDRRPLFQQAQVEYPLTDVLRKRRIIMTRDEFPRHSFREMPNWNPKVAVNKDQERLVCRYIYQPIYETAWNPKAKRRPKAVEGLIRRVTKAESDTCDNYFGTDHAAEHAKQHLQGHVMTYVSGCCGAGGDVTGAKQAGMQPVVAFDHWETAIATAKMNHPDVKFYVCDQAAAIDTSSSTRIEAPENLTVLHCSFPCVFFSPAHTVQGKDDDKNDALILATGNHLRYWKPLVHTQEQTSGILSHHPDWFFTIVSDIVKERYNIRWKVCRFEQYGLPALRKRLIIFAARYVLSNPSPPN
jgi:DNA (cytosine-5)-methyltransferase 1